MDLKEIGRSIRTFNYEESARTLGTQAISYSIGGVPLITYGCMGLTAGLLGVMFFYEDGNEGAKPKPEPEPEPETEVSPSPMKEGGKKKRKTRRKHKKKK